MRLLFVCALVLPGCGTTQGFAELIQTKIMPSLSSLEGRVDGAVGALDSVQGALDVAGQHITSLEGEIGLVKGGVGVISGGLEEAKKGIEEVRMRRTQSGEDPDGPIGVREILTIAGYFVTGLGVNAWRGMTRRRELDKKADRTVGVT